MTEGTKSYLFGCHNFLIHPLCVLFAWKKHYRQWPMFWQIVCIFLHDIGICGMNYLSVDKKGHWRKGAKIALKLFGRKGYLFCKGHTSENGFKSKLWIADKKSWLIAPRFWLWCNYYIEGFKVITPPLWISLVKKELEKENPKGAHELYLSAKEQL